MIDPAYSAAAKIAFARAKREGLVIHHMCWKDGHLSWLGRPKKEAMKLASGSEIVFRGKGGAIVSMGMADAPGAKGVGGRGALGPGLARQGELI